MTNFDVELIDVSDNIENFKFHKIKKEDLDRLLNGYKKNDPFIEFVSIEGNIIMRTSLIRGIMYQKFEEKEKNVHEENREAAEEISKVKLKKTIFNTTGSISHA